jgi:hypothetical protein
MTDSADKKKIYTKANRNNIHMASDITDFGFPKVYMETPTLG